MYAIDTHEVELARDVLYGALNRCPLECSLQDCQFCEMREEPLNLRHQWLLQLDDVECVTLARKHRECVRSQIDEAMISVV